MQIVNINTNYNIKSNHEIYFGRLKLTQAQRLEQTIMQHCFDKNLTKSDVRLLQTIDYAVEHFKHKKHVNTYIYEYNNPYLAVIYLYSKYGEKIASKFMPIFAKNCEQNVLAAAKSGIVEMNPSEYRKIQKYTGFKFSEFFAENPSYEKVKEGTQFHANPKYYSKINFSNTGLIDDYRNIKPRNTLLITGDVFSKMSKKQIYNLSMNIAKRMKSGDLWSIRENNGNIPNEVLTGIVPAGYTADGCPGGLYKKSAFGVTAKDIFDYFSEKLFKNFYIDI